MLFNRTAVLAPKKPPYREIFARKKSKQMTFALLNFWQRAARTADSVKVMFKPYSDC
jgi:hypothetical protein